MSGRLPILIPAPLRSLRGDLQNLQGDEVVLFSCSIHLSPFSSSCAMIRVFVLIDFICDEVF